MKAYIVTGTTRGIGLAIADAVVAAKDQLLSLSSAPDDKKPNWKNIQCDLRQHQGIGEKLKHLLQTESSEAYQEVVLINNAGVLDPMGPIHEASGSQILEHLLVNQAAPAILMSEFIRLTENTYRVRRIINISSGAARHHYSGWSLYCASKAALDMMALCVAAEQEDRKHPVSVCCVSPGKVETRMQRKIRQFDKVKFPRQPDFVNAKLRGELNTAKEVADLILKLDNSGELKNGGIYDLRDAIFDGRRCSIRPTNSLMTG